MNYYKSIKMFFKVNRLYYNKESCVRCLHIYKSIYCPSSELAEDLCNKIIYNDKGIVVLNKPYGISFAQEDDKSIVPHDENEVSLKTMLPFIRKRLGYPKLLNARVPERYTSGVAILCTNEEIVKKIHTNLRIMRDSGGLHDEYEAVVVGHPISKSGEFSGGITLLHNSKVANWKKANLTLQLSNNAVKRGEMKRVKLSHKTESEGEWASLVHVLTSRNSWHCVRTYLSTQLLCPILGDNVFGSRVKTLLGSPVLIDISSPAAMAPQQIPVQLKKKLNIDGRKDISVPLHLHLSKIIIPNLHSKRKNTEFIAPRPELFQWTCQQLSLVDQSDLLYNLR